MIDLISSVDTLLSYFGATLFALGLISCVLPRLFKLGVFVMLVANIPLIFAMAFPRKVIEFALKMGVHPSVFPSVETGNINGMVAAVVLYALMAGTYLFIFKPKKSAGLSSFFTRSHAKSSAAARQDPTAFTDGEDDLPIANDVDAIEREQKRGLAFILNKRMRRNQRSSAMHLNKDADLSHVNKKYNASNENADDVSHGLSLHDLSQAGQHDSFDNEPSFDAKSVNNHLNRKEPSFSGIADSYPNIPGDVDALNIPPVKEDQREVVDIPSSEVEFKTKHLSDEQNAEKQKNPSLSGLISKLNAINEAKHASNVEPLKHAMPANEDIEDSNDGILAGAKLSDFMDSLDSDDALNSRLNNRQSNMSRANPEENNHSFASLLNSASQNQKANAYSDVSSQDDDENDDDIRNALAQVYSNQESQQQDYVDDEPLEQENTAPFGRHKTVAELEAELMQQEAQVRAAQDAVKAAAKEANVDYEEQASGNVNIGMTFGFVSRTNEGDAQSFADSANSLKNGVEAFVDRSSYIENTQYVASFGDDEAETEAKAQEENTKTQIAPDVDSEAMQRVRDRSRELEMELERLRMLVRERDMLLARLAQDPKANMQHNAQPAAYQHQVSVASEKQPISHEQALAYEQALAREQAAAQLAAAEQAAAEQAAAQQAAAQHAAAQQAAAQQAAYQHALAREQALLQQNNQVALAPNGMSHFNTGAASSMAHLPESNAFANSTNFGSEHNLASSFEMPQDIAVTPAHLSNQRPDEDVHAPVVLGVEIAPPDAKLTVPPPIASTLGSLHLNADKPYALDKSRIDAMQDEATGLAERMAAKLRNAVTKPEEAPTDGLKHLASLMGAKHGVLELNENTGLAHNEKPLTVAEVLNKLRSEVLSTVDEIDQKTAKIEENLEAKAAPAVAAASAASKNVRTSAQHLRSLGGIAAKMHSKNLQDKVNANTADKAIVDNDNAKKLVKIAPPAASLIDKVSAHNKAQNELNQGKAVVKAKPVGFKLAEDAASAASASSAANAELSKSTEKTAIASNVQPSSAKAVAVPTANNSNVAVKAQAQRQNAPQASAARASQAKSVAPNVRAHNTAAVSNVAVNAANKPASNNVKSMNPALAAKAQAQARVQLQAHASNNNVAVANAQKMQAANAMAANKVATSAQKPALNAQQAALMQKNMLAKRAAMAAAAKNAVVAKNAVNAEINKVQANANVEANKAPVAKIAVAPASKRLATGAAQRTALVAKNQAAQSNNTAPKVQAAPKVAPQVAKAAAEVKSENVAKKPGAAKNAASFKAQAPNANAASAVKSAAVNAAAAGANTAAAASAAKSAAVAATATSGNPNPGGALVKKAAASNAAAVASQGAATKPVKRSLLKTRLALHSAKTQEEKDELKPMFLQPSVVQQNFKASLVEHEANGTDPVSDIIPIAANESDPQRGLKGSLRRRGSLKSAQYANIEAQRQDEDVMEHAEDGLDNAHNVRIPKHSLKSRDLHR